MKIYFAHSTAFDYQEEYYNPIHSASWSKDFELVFPHEHNAGLYDSQGEMRSFDLVVAEVSYPSIGLGIELGWANSIGIPILCIYKKGTKYSSSLHAVTDNFIDYQNREDMVQNLGIYLNSIKK
ncbi:MAG: hypothetical protein QY330_02950 [Candidatus Dojkabacteria bacterium]|nr:MAG: hypothetical protein QY330_02950 [Candidatus Dojkabacteria bacterium]